MKHLRILAVLFPIAFLIVFPNVSHAATCYEDACDGTHDGIVGCNSPSSGLFHYTNEDQQLVEQDGPNQGRLDGVVEFWSDTVGSTHCNTFWGTVIMYNTYATFLHVFTYRQHGKFLVHDDDIQLETDYVWPNYTTGYKDAPEAGIDDPVSDPDCGSEGLFWGWDNSNGVDHTQGLGSSEICTFVT